MAEVDQASARDDWRADPSRANGLLVAKFFVEVAGRRGERLRLLATTVDLPANASVLSCDPRIRQWLASQDSFVTILSDDHCVLGHLPDSSKHHVVVE